MRAWFKLPSYLKPVRCFSMSVNRATKMSDQRGISPLQTVIVVVGIIMIVLSIVLAVWYYSGDRSWFPSSDSQIDRDVLEKTESREVTIIENKVKLEFSTFNGYIMLQPVNADKLTIDILKKGTEEGLNNIEIKFSEQVDADGLQVINFVARKVNSFLFNAQESVRLEVMVPIQVSYFLDLETSNGYVDVSRISGTDLNIQTSNGGLTLSDIDFTNIQADTSNGRVVGTIRSDYAEIQTSNGGISLTVVGAGDYNLQTSNGKVDIQLQSNLPARVDARTSNADLEWVGVPINIAQSERDRLIAQTEGFDEATTRIDVLIRTSNGDITVTSEDSKGQNIS